MKRVWTSNMSKWSGVKRAESNLNKDIENLNVESVHGTQILPHLYRVVWWNIAGDDVVNCDVFAVDCGETVILIDAGRGGSSYPLMKENLVHWGLWNRVKLCLLTHMHLDHVGGVPCLRNDGVGICGGRSAVAAERHEKAQAYFGGKVPVIDRALADGEGFTVDNVRFQMLDTPGHTSTCVCYFATIDGVRCAFTGDMVMPNGGIGYSGSFDFDDGRLLSSILRVVQYEPEAVLTGHMLASSQPEGFWMKDGKMHLLRTYEAGLAGKWKLADR